MTLQKSYSMNVYRVMSMKEGYVVTAEHGGWTFLKEDEYENLVLNSIDENLFTKLEESGIIITEKNENKIIRDYRNRKIFLFRGTSLHIIVVTNRCNFKCSYCHMSSAAIADKSQDMSIETAKKVVDFIFQSPSPTIEIEFQGGEPLVNFDVVKFIIEYAQEKNVTAKKILGFNITTNSSLLSDAILDYFVENNVSISISLDGPDFVHDKNRMFEIGLETHNIVSKKIFHIRERYPEFSKSRLSALLTITRNSLPYGKEIVDEYLKHKFSGIHLRFLNRLGFALTMWDQIGYSGEEFGKFWTESMDYILELNKRGVHVWERGAGVIAQKVLNGIDPSYTELMSPCGGIIAQMTYGVDGNVYTCDEGRMTKTDTFNIGHASQTYKEVYKSENVSSFIALSTNDTLHCDTCAWKPYCGQCPVLNLIEQNNIIPKLSASFRCKILKITFYYMFDKIINDPDARSIFENWANISNIEN